MLQHVGTRRLLSTIAAAVIVAACAAEGPLGAPNGSAAHGPLHQVEQSADSRGPDLGTCTNLAAPAESELLFKTYARGVQIYRWNGTAWAFVAPEADLFAAAEFNGKVGIHYVGPTWEIAKSKLTAARLDGCTVSPADIPWLKLGVTTDSGKGVLAGSTHILRVHTVGGIAPSTAGSAIGDERRVPYTATYYFYGDR